MSLLDSVDERREAYIAGFDALLWETAERNDVAPADFRVGGRKTKAWPDGETIEFWMASGFDQIERYLEWIEATDWDIATVPDGRPAIEWDAQVMLGGFPTRLVIDCIYQNRAGELIVVDYKSGSHNPSSPEQLGLYATALELTYGPQWRPRWGAYYMTRRAELLKLENLDKWTNAYFGYQLASMEVGITAGLYPPTIDDHCNWCSVSAYCPARDGEFASQYPLPIGQG